MNINNKAYLSALILLIIFFVTFNLSSCDSTEPIEEKPPKEYSTWVADTISSQNGFQTTLSSVWSSSKDDIYVCGHSSGPEGVWHYNGTEWNNINLNEQVGQSANITAVSGYSASDVWIVGYNINYNSLPLPYIIQFNGMNWRKYDLNVDTRINSVLMENQNKVWVCGSSGIIGQFDRINLTWELDTIDIPLKNYDDIDLRKIVGDEKNKYILSTATNGTSNDIYIFRLLDGKWEIFDSQSSSDNANRFGYTNIFYSRFEQLSTVGPYLYECNKEWSTFIPDFFTGLWSYFAHNPNNKIVAGTGKVFHKRGDNDWESIKILMNENVLYRDIWMDDEVAIIIGNISNARTIVWVGE